jgi:protein SCO1/2
MSVVAMLALRLVPRSSASVPEYGSAPQFSLTDQLGRPVADRDLRGKVVLANFIYTSCPDICPTTSGQMRTMQDLLREAGLLDADVRLLSITFDPTRDTPAQLRSYAEGLRADPERWRFLTGEASTVRQVVVQGFALEVKVMAPAVPGQEHGNHSTDAHAHSPYEVSHSGRFVLIDRSWHIGGYYESADLVPEQLLSAIEALATGHENQR